MTTWTQKHIDAIHHDNDLKVAPDRDADRTPVLLARLGAHHGLPARLPAFSRSARLIWLWAVEVDGDVYLRSANQSSRGFASAATFGRESASIDEEEVRVSFALVDADEVRDRVDAAFRLKYQDDSYFSGRLLDGSRNQIARVRPIAE